MEQLIKNHEIIKSIEEDLIEGFRDLKGLDGVNWHQSDTCEYFSTGCSVPWLNTVLYSKADEAHLLKLVSDIVSYYKDKNLEAVWRISELCNEKEKLNNILAAKGFEKSTEPVMVLDLESLNPSEPLSELEIQTVDTKIIEEWMVPFAACFELNSSDAKFFQRYWKKVSNEDDNLKNFIGRIDNQVVSCGSISLNSKVPVIYNIGTLPSYQRHGYATKMTTHCANQAQKKGFSKVSLFSSDEGFRTYQKIGFKEIGTVNNYLIK